MLGIVSKTITGGFSLGPVHFGYAMYENFKRVNFELTFRLDHYRTQNVITWIENALVIIKVDFYVFQFPHNFFHKNKYLNELTENCLE